MVRGGECRSLGLANVCVDTLQTMPSTPRQLPHHASLITASLAAADVVTDL